MEKIFDYLKNHPKATTHEVASACGLNYNRVRNFLYYQRKKKVVIKTSKKIKVSTWFGPSTQKRDCWSLNS